MPQFAAVFDLSTLNGRNGFQISGESAFDRCGESVSSAGDINGDGFDDVIIGARWADYETGFCYVVFGKAGGVGPNLDLSTLDGSSGFQMIGEAEGDFFGESVASAGDVNGDGFDDLIIGAPGADSHGGFSGASYVVFGKAGGFAANIDLSKLNGSNGFQLSGEAQSDASGRSVSSAGDLNGDGFDDLLIGAPYAEATDYGQGATYVVFGKAEGFAANLDLSSLDGTTGFRIDGEDRYDGFGISVSTAGDVNGDGFDDLVVGADDAAPNGYQSGASYVVFGKPGGFAATLDLSALDGSNGFKISGQDAYSFSGNSVASAGDVNGDGFADVIIGAPGVASYVVFGKGGGFSANLAVSALNGVNGFKIVGEESPNFGGRPISAAGDINGDGFDDLIIGAPDSGQSGASYVVFGKAGGFNASFNLSAIDGNNGFQILSPPEGVYSGEAVSYAGDVNGDGFDDIVIGDSGAGLPDSHYSRYGASYVIFGHRALTAVTIAGTDIAQTSNGGYGNDTISGNGGNDTLIGWEGADSLSGGDGKDVLRGRSGADVMRGDAGNDMLAGGGGNDIMAGGAGTDTFSYLLITHGNDRINDFQGGGVAGGDIINLSAIDAVAGGSDDAFQFGGTTATAHGLWYALLPGRAMLYADTDGNTATAEMTIALIGVTALTGGDFLL